MLFHYHYWTPYLEETEKFYVENGFRISQRIGKYQGEFQNFNPPLEWDDFREKKVLFRIIEARKGSINITFGYGKKIIFDHIGFLVSEKELNALSENADRMNWNVDRSERRTFITTPYGFRVELQTHKDIVDSMEEALEELRLETRGKGLENDLAQLFGKPVNNITTIIGDKVAIREAILKDFSSSPTVDPNGVKVLTSSS